MKEDDGFKGMIARGKNEVLLAFKLLDLIKGGILESDLVKMIEQELHTKGGGKRALTYAYKAGAITKSKDGLVTLAVDSVEEGYELWKDEKKRSWRTPDSTNEILQQAMYDGLEDYPEITLGPPDEENYALIEAGKPDSRLCCLVRRCKTTYLLVQCLYKL
jgi:hypothetical protein